MKPPEVVVVGAGVIGLTTALTLLRSGVHVRILADEDDWQASCSGAAAAFWYPYHANPVERVAKWGSFSLDQFKKLARDEASGVKIHSMLETSNAQKENPWWAQIVDNFKTAAPDELPNGYTSGIWFDTPIIDTSVYMPFLLNEVNRLGGSVKRQRLNNWTDLKDHEKVVVNCTGIGSKELCQDDDLKPGKGQVLRIKKRGPDTPILDCDGDVRFAHITPRIHDTIIGGIYFENDSDLTPLPSETEAIIARCKRLSPGLIVEETDILGISCGLRPVRSSVRLETEEMENNRTVIHNYGHGGAGYTLSWGCAAEVYELLESLAER